MATFKEMNQQRIVAAWMICFSVVLLNSIARAERPLKENFISLVDKEQVMKEGLLSKMYHFLWKSGEPSYQPVWPDMEFGWRIVVGSFIGFLGAALGSVGGVGGGGIFVPMLTLIIGFDPKSSTAISKCMIMGAAASTVYCNLSLKHPTLDMPIIDYDLAVLIQPMLMLGISIGVTFNVIFADWMVTVLLIILFLVTSIKALLKGVNTWNKESEMKKIVASMHVPDTKSGEESEADYKPLASGPPAPAHDDKVPMLSNIYWKELSLLSFVWLGFLVIQLLKRYTVTCSVQYWLLDSLQVPIAVSVSLFEGVCLYKGTKVIASKGKEITVLKVHQIFFYCICGVVAGMVGGLLGLGGGFILGPLFLELGIPPQVASATSTFSMIFSSSMSVVQYYILKRFPVPYAAYFVLVATLAAIVGQHVVRRLITLLGRASIIIFILASTILVSAITLGGVGIVNMIQKLENHEYMGFENFCHRP
ncbi:sulfite exporter TauE/SafE family protein 3 isoform X1 [Beta vulgaris subsp. vulgaris]|uniref:sulfite exporter TauE/SafE family protein 3 isoform X1 n=1 Tax=Beta vulgaris subsp. vulgaris TaxID=3555 RepID=UPI002036BCC4|nr:sulfite exporter TauE/SafE family protein 3 isoform X1 [Beta vulgaris subsp. vulgaris]